MPAKICGDRGTDAEADRNDALAGLRSHQMVENHEGVREQRPRARPAAAKAKQRRRGIGRRSLRRDSHPSQAFAVGRPDLETLS